MENAFEALTNSVKISVNVENPLLLNAIAEIKAKNKIEETAAVDTLIRKVLTDIRWKQLWDGAPAIYNSFKELFEHSNKVICSCVTNKVKPGTMKEFVRGSQ